MMAGPACMSQDGRQAVFVGTMLQTGDAVALCDECLVPWCAAVLQAMTGVDPAPFILAVSEPADQPGVTEGAASDQPPAPAPADTDPDLGTGGDGYAAGWVKNGDPPPTVSNGGRRGRTRTAPASDAAASGANQANS